MKVQVCVKFPGEKDVPSVRLTVGPRETVAGLKDRLAVVQPSTALKQDLVFSGVTLKDDSKRLADCGIAAGSELELVNASGTSASAELSKQLADLLQEQGKPVSVDELPLLYSYRFGGCISEALRTSGQHGSLDGFLKSAAGFELSCGSVSLLGGARPEHDDAVSQDISVERQVQDILEQNGGDASCMDVMELCMVFSKKHQSSLASVVGMKPMDYFMTNQHLFTVTGRKVGLRKVFACKQQAKSSPGQFQRALQTVMTLLMESCFLNVNCADIVTADGKQVCTANKADEKCQLRCQLPGIGHVSQDRWLPSLLRSVCGVYNERIAADAFSGDYSLLERVEVEDGMLCFYAKADTAVRVHFVVAGNADMHKQDNLGAVLETPQKKAEPGTPPTPAGGFSEVSTVASCTREISGSSSAASSSSPSGSEDVVQAAPVQAAKRTKFVKGDMQLLACFSEICGLPEVDGSVAKLLLKAIGMLRRCRYPAEDVCAILAHAGSYWKMTKQKHSGPMEAAEVGNVLILAMYIAHSYTQDEVCPLRTWHRILFEGYCSVKDLNVAITRLMSLWDYKLRVEDDELLRHWKMLREATGAPAEPFAYGGVSRD